MALREVDVKRKKGGIREVFKRNDGKKGGGEQPDGISNIRWLYLVPDSMLSRGFYKVNGGV